MTVGTLVGTVPRVPPDMALKLDELKEAEQVGSPPRLAFMTVRGPCLFCLQFLQLQGPFVPPFLGLLLLGPKCCFLVKSLATPGGNMGKCLPNILIKLTNLLMIQTAMVFILTSSYVPDTVT